MEPARVARITLGVVLALLGAGLITGAVVLAGALTFGTDDDGFFTFGPHRFATPTHALVSEELDLGADPGPVDWAAATVRVRVEGDDGSPLFLGIGRSEVVDGQLDGVAHAVVTDVSSSPFEATYRTVPGDAVPAPPATWDGWATTVEGTGEIELEWEVEAGEWTLVVMDADAGRDVIADIEVGVQVDRLGTIATVLGVVGALLLAVGIVVLVPAVRRAGPAVPVTTDPAGWPTAPPAG
ncbi:MAG TPA: hypothetical protein VK866_13645 [Acidimicrobiales bacterium]|nr:hypothetical protein [Acidimicrobiales bacterium]